MTIFLAGLRFHTDGAVLQESASSILLALCLHMDKTKETVKDLFSRIGKEVSLTDGDAGAEAHLAELKQALLAIDIPHTDAAIHDVMAKLDVSRAMIAGTWVAFFREWQQ